MKKYKVAFYGLGKMADIVYGVLLSLDNVEIVCGMPNPDPAQVLALGKIDLIFSACWPHRIYQEMVEATAFGAVNLHTGLLPEGRGWHPLNWALVWGKQKTGITIHKIVDSYDAGNVCLQQEVPIFETDNIVRLRERVDALVPGLIQEFFRNPEQLIARAVKQNQALVTYAPKRRPEDSELNLDASWNEIYNLFRSCDPVDYPAFVMQNGVKRIVQNVLPSNQVIVYAE